MHDCTHCGELKFISSFVCVLHTFGRPLEWNPNIHCLLAEGGFSDDSFRRGVKHFNYTYQRKAFQIAILSKLEQHTSSFFKRDNNNRRILTKKM